MSGSSADSALSLSCMTRFPQASVVFAGRQTVAVKGKRILYVMYVRYMFQLMCCCQHVWCLVLVNTRVQFKMRFILFFKRVTYPTRHPPATGHCHFSSCSMASAGVRKEAVPPWIMGNLQIAVVNDASKSTSPGTSINCIFPLSPIGINLHVHWSQNSYPISKTCQEWT